MTSVRAGGIVWKLIYLLFTYCVLSALIDVSTLDPTKEYGHKTRDAKLDVNSVILIVVVD